MEFTFDFQHGCLGPRDLVPFVGSCPRGSEVLSGRRQITMSLARALHENLGIASESPLGWPTIPIARSATVQGKLNGACASV